MHYAQIRKYDVANGLGIRTTVFLSGCTHNCPNCFNKEYQDFKMGDIWTDEQTNEVLGYLKSPHVKGLSLLGGEPFQNLWFTEILRVIKDNLRADQSIWVWSGYLFEELVSNPQRLEMLKLCDVLVDGKFIEEKKNLRLKFRGSENQRVIDIKKSLDKGEVVEYDECE